ncbi:MAG TPA: hypothetical protein VNO33_10425 [Kofleriaceae bacterium]|nr:hypothetical protein [Kofleriaceae bacterium]
MKTAVDFAPARGESRVQARVIEMIRRRFGRCEEELVRAGILDSLRSIELALELESEFGVSMDELHSHDMATLSCLCRRLVELGAAP